jgi:septal ring factor EnvC (AmiA/AmiB activator)
MNTVAKSEYATISDVRQIVGESNKEVVELLNDVIELFDKRFNSLETKLFNHDSRFDQLDSRLDDLDRKFYRLLDQMDAFVGRIDHFETESAARDHKYARLEAWMELVAKKTGVPMPAVF